MILGSPTKDADRILSEFRSKLFMIKFEATHGFSLTEKIANNQAARGRMMSGAEVGRMSMVVIGHCQSRWE